MVIDDHKVSLFGELMGIELARCAVLRDFCKNWLGYPSLGADSIEKYMVAARKLHRPGSRDGL